MNYSDLKLFKAEGHGTKQRWHDLCIASIPRDAAANGLMTLVLLFSANGLWSCCCFPSFVLFGAQRGYWEDDDDEVVWRRRKALLFRPPRASALKSEALKRALDCSRNNNSLLSWASRVLFDRPRQQQGLALVDGPPSRDRCSVGVDGNRQQFSNIFFPPFLSRLLLLALRRPLPLAIWPSRGQQKNVCICHQH